MRKDYGDEASYPILEIANNATISTIAQLADRVGVNVLGDEANRTIGEQCMAATNVKAEWLVVWTTVVLCPWASGWSTGGRCVLVDDPL